MKKTIFTYNKSIHNLDGPREISTVVYDMLKPESVVDLGCGIGAFLKVFKEMGVKRVLGFDTNEVDRSSFPKYLEENEFIEANLEKPIDTGDKFDLAICLEVAEHIKPESSEILVENLTKLSDIILFSAAVPFQKGENHVNEQWPDFWQHKFEKMDFIFYDVLRKRFWNNERISYWHRQNIFLIVSKYKKISFLKESETDVQAIIHPVLYLKKAEALENLLKGEFRILFYLKLITITIIRKLIRLFSKNRHHL